MSELFASRPGAVEKIGVSTAPSFSTPVTSGGIYRVFSNRLTHIRISPVTAAVTDTPIYPFHPYFVNLAAGEQIAFIKATGEIDGDVWITYEGNR